MKKILLTAFYVCLFATIIYSQSATSTIPVSIGVPCGSGGGTTDSIMYFNYDATKSTMKRLSACRPPLASPGISAFNTGVSYNPKDGYLYFQRYNSAGSYIWRWQPGSCPNNTVPVYQFYANQMILGIDFDANGIGYQIIFTGSAAPFGLALQRVDFKTGTLGPIENIDLQGKQIMTQNGDMVITSGNQFLMVWDNLYFSLNYEDYNTGKPLIATYISTIALPGSTKLVGLAYAQGKLVGSASSCGYYDFNILTGKLTDLTESPNLQFATDMTNITSGIGVAKNLVSATPVSAGVYDLVYDIKVENFGDYPISNVQVTEDLTTVHPLGSAVISKVSSEWVENPAGLVLNDKFDGTKKFDLIDKNQTLPNAPVSNDYFIVRVKFRLSSVVSGVVYNNSAVGTGNGYNNVSLLDSSTNGSHPDLNDNFKPDDPGENQPTPFSVSVSAETPPCNSIATILYSQDFGTGVGVTTSLPGTVITQYAAGTNPLDEETYLLSNDAYNANSTKYITLTDHTGNANGRMLIVNADVNNYKLFEDVVNISCVNLKYSLIVNAANIMNDTYNTFCDAFGGTSKPKLTLIVRNYANNNIIANISTGDITDRTWNSFGMKFVMPAGVSKVKIQIYNTGEGGCGNAVALDDIKFGICDPSPVISTTLTNAGCPGVNNTFVANLSDTTGMSSVLQYQWQVYTNALKGWSNIAGATSTQYSYSPVNGLLDQPSFRIMVAANGNLGNDACQYLSNSLLVSLKDSSTAPAFVTSNKAFVCPGEPAILTVHGGSLGSNAVWKWYQGSCSGTFVDTGTTLLVHPLLTTKYYVSAEGECNTTQCVFITMPQLCLLANETVDLKGSIQAQNSNLLFTVISDKKIKTIEVERSTDGVNFTTIKTLQVNDYADSRGYNVKDNISADHVNTFYYRVKINGDNTSGYYSKILELTRSGNNFNTMVSPNPANEKIRISFYTAEASKVEIKLFNTQGQAVKSENILSAAGINNYFMDRLSNLPSGIYNLSITSANKTSHAKVIIQR